MEQTLEEAVEALAKLLTNSLASLDKSLPPSQLREQIFQTVNYAYTIVGVLGEEAYHRFLASVPEDVAQQLALLRGPYTPPQSDSTAAPFTGSILQPGPTTNPAPAASQAGVDATPHATVSSTGAHQDLGQLTDSLLESVRIDPKASFAEYVKTAVLGRLNEPGYRERLEWFKTESEGYETLRSSLLAHFLGTSGTSITREQLNKAYEIAADGDIIKKLEPLPGLKASPLYLVRSGRIYDVLKKLAATKIIPMAEGISDFELRYIFGEHHIYARGQVAEIIMQALGEAPSTGTGRYGTRAAVEQLQAGISNHYIILPEQLMERAGFSGDMQQFLTLLEEQADALNIKMLNLPNGALYLHPHSEFKTLPEKLRDIIQGHQPSTSAGKRFQYTRTPEKLTFGGRAINTHEEYMGWYALQLLQRINPGYNEQAVESIFGRGKGMIPGVHLINLVEQLATHYLVIEREEKLSEMVEKPLKKAGQLFQTGEVPYLTAVGHKKLLAYPIAQERDLVARLQALPQL